MKECLAVRRPGAAPKPPHYKPPSRAPGFSAAFPVPRAGPQAAAKVHDCRANPFWCGNKSSRYIEGNPSENTNIISAATIVAGLRAGPEQPMDKTIVQE